MITLLEKKVAPYSRSTSVPLEDLRAIEDLNDSHKQSMMGSCMDRSGWNRPPMFGDCDGIASVFNEAIVKSKVLIVNRIHCLTASLYVNNKRISKKLGAG